MREMQIRGRGVSHLAKKRPDTLAISKKADVLIHCNDGSAWGPGATAMLSEKGYAKAVEAKGGMGSRERADFPV